MTSLSSRLAVLMMVHKDGEFVSRLVSQLSCPGVDFFLHVDKKSAIASEIAPQLRGGLVFVPDAEREDVRWGQNQDNRAVFKLMRLAASHSEKNGVTYHHYILLSGQDYPIRPVGDLVGYLASAPSTDYIEVLGPETGNYKDFLTRVCLYWPPALIRRSVLARAIAGLYRRVGKVLLTRHIVRGGCPARTFYFGSLWWALSSETVAWMLDAVERNPDWINWFDHALNPDECLFQTLFMTSPFAGRQHPILTYVDWSEGGSSPKVIQMEDLPSLRGSGCYLARKFDPTVDAMVLDAIDDGFLIAQSVS